MKEAVKRDHHGPLDTTLSLLVISQSANTTFFQSIKTPMENNMKFILYIDSSPPWIEKINELAMEFPEVEFIPQEKRTDKDLKEAHALIGGWIPPEDIKHAEELKMIFVSFTGPNMLPFQYLKERRIRLSNTHGNARYVAERGIAMVLSLYGKIIDYHLDLQKAKWHGIWSGRGLQDTWESIYGKHCAVIGTGEIGKWIAKFLAVFNCRITGFKKRPVSEKPEYFDEITLDLKEALDKSELIFITLPLTMETQGLFDTKILSGLHGKVLINLGRGGVIDERGLYESLKGGVLKGACIDVWYDYPERGTGSGYPSKYPFHELPNVVLSPHVGGFTSQAAQLNVEQTIQNIRAYLKTGRAHFEIDLDLMY
jgi:phosphoglycerate dehydrogenase-like enzyme